MPSFHYALARVSSFPRMVFLDLEPASPFAALRTAVDHAFERCLPEDPFPRYAQHLSVARHVHRTRSEIVAELDSALAESGGAIRATCKAVVLLERTGGGSWQVQLNLPIGQPHSI